MFRPAIQKLSVLIGMALFCVLMVLFSFKSQKDYKKSFYNQKVTASNYMFNAMKVLRSSFLKIPNKKLDEGEVYIDSNNNVIILILQQKLYYYIYIVNLDHSLAL